MLEFGNYEIQALRHLVEIYEQEQDWTKALEFSTRLEAASGESRADERAHFLCEQAQEHLDRGLREEGAEASATAGQHLAEHPGVAKISFTGSTATGTAGSRGAAGGGLGEEGHAEAADHGQERHDQ